MGFHSKRSGRGTATLSMPRLYCARCGQRLKYQVVGRGDWFGIGPTATRCPQCGSSVLRNGETMTVMPRGR